MAEQSVYRSGAHTEMTGVSSGSSSSSNSSSSSAKDDAVAPAITGAANLNKALLVLPGALQPWKPTMMSYTASLATIFCGYPLDTLKTRMQTHRFRSTWHCAQQTFKHEGLFGFYRGLTSPLVMASVSKSLGVSLYSLVKPQVARVQGWFYTPLTAAGPVKNHDLRLALNNLPVAVASGAFAGACVSLYACPFEFNKIFSQIAVIVRNTQNVQTTVPRNVFQVAREIVRHEGLRGLYSGYRFHVVRDTVSNALFFAVYETAKITMHAFTEDGRFKGTSVPAGQISVVAAGGAAGMISWFTVFPIDTLKSMAQRDIVTNILRARDGLDRLPVQRRSLGLPTRRMYRGLAPSLTRSVLTTMIFFSVYEYLMARIA